MQQWTFCSTDISRYFEHSITPWLPTLNNLEDLHIVRLHALEGDAAGGSLLQDYHNLTVGSKVIQMAGESQAPCTLSFVGLCVKISQLKHPVRYL